MHTSGHSGQSGHQGAFRVHEVGSAPEESRATLGEVERGFGMIPNLERVMASAPALLRAYATAWELFDATALTPVERQVVYQTANFINECDYCVPWHTLLSQQAGMSPADVEALRSGGVLGEPRLEALRQFTREVVLQRGKVTPGDVERFMRAGYTDRHALEVVLGVAIKVMSNYTNSIAGTPLDRQVTKHAWRKPKVSPRGTDAGS